MHENWPLLPMQIYGKQTKAIYYALQIMTLHRSAILTHALTLEMTDPLDKGVGAV